MDRLALSLHSRCCAWALLERGMNEATDCVVERAERACSESGLRLTPKRRNVLLTLLQADGPLTAYELAAQYQSIFGEPIPMMSVYRMLDILVQVELAHKLDTTTQYVACAHIACDHQHEVPQFLICDQCHSVAEIGVSKALVEQLRKSVERTGFRLKRQQLELHGACASCRKR